MLFILIDTVYFITIIRFCKYGRYYAFDIIMHLLLFKDGIAFASNAIQNARSLAVSAQLSLWNEPIHGSAY